MGAVLQSRWTRMERQENRLVLGGRTAQAAQILKESSLRFEKTEIFCA